MAIKLNWALFLLSAAGGVFYPVWHFPAPLPVQWLFLNLTILIAVVLLYSPLGEVSLDTHLPELRRLWPAILLAAAVRLPLWGTPIAIGGDEQSHAGPTAWAIGRAATGLGLNIDLLPLLFIFTVSALLLAAGLLPKHFSPPGRKAAGAALAVAGNLFFFASVRFGLADSVGSIETLLRYPPLSKFLYLAAYATFGLREAAPRIVQFIFICLTAVYILRFLRLLEIKPRENLVFLTIVFFPTFFNLSITAELEAGTVFFFAAAMYHFTRAAETGARDQFLKLAFWLSAGLLYKQLVLGILIPIVPALLLLWITKKKDRLLLGFGLKTIFIPALVAAPFFLASVGYGLATDSSVSDLGLRGSGLILSNLYSFKHLTLNFAALYDTCGLPLTALLLLSLGYCAYFRPGLKFLLPLYFSLAYYFMIGITGAAGYIRHAQPFYIAPALALALAASELTSALPARAAKVLSAVFISFLVFLSALTPAPYQRKTFFNYSQNVFPYREVAGYLKGLDRPGLKIYAPMEVEPSHFYLAKAGMAGKLTWDRTMPAHFSPAVLEKNFRAGNFDFLVLPGTNFEGIPADFEATGRELLASDRFCEARSFSYAGNKLSVLKPCAE